VDVGPNRARGCGECPADMDISDEECRAAGD